MSIEDQKYVLDRVSKMDSGCWEWSLRRDKYGYGRMFRAGVSHYAHRFSFTSFVGPIPSNKEIDHKCRNRGCCNPEHLRAVDHRENMANSVYALSDKCKSGHVLSGDNLYVYPRGGRGCRACNRGYFKAHKARRVPKV